MSTNEIARIEHVTQLIHSVEPTFTELAKIHHAVTFAREAAFAIQILKENDYLASVAASNPDSLKNAIINVAAIGLSLSPVHKLAYLVPRKKKICLDISYRGYVQLATESGSIKWVHAEVVCETDVFKSRGLGREPLHEFDPFRADRGNIVGAYAAAKTSDGEFLTTVMPGDEIKAVRDRSESWRAYERDNSKINPWVTDTNEMIKKTVIRRAQKTWPMGGMRSRFDQAVDVDPIDTSPLAIPSSGAAADTRLTQITEIRSLLTAINRSEPKLVEHLVRVLRRDIKSIDDLLESETPLVISMLTNIRNNESKKIQEASRENAG